MKVANKIARTLGRIEGQLTEIRNLNVRVSKLEAWHSWLKGGWATLVAAYVLFHGIYGK